MKIVNSKSKYCGNTWFNGKKYYVFKTQYHDYELLRHCKVIVSDDPYLVEEWGMSDTNQPFKRPTYFTLKNTN
jgi:hypothetical protein